MDRQAGIRIKGAVALVLLLLAGACQPAGDGVPRVQAPGPEVQAAAAPAAAPEAVPAREARKPEAKKTPPPLPPFRPGSPARAERHMISAANPLAAQAGLGMLRAGGAAGDAARAPQMCLTLVEPPSSGNCGGRFRLHFSEGTGGLSPPAGRRDAPARPRP